MIEEPVKPPEPLTLDTNLLAELIADKVQSTLNLPRKKCGIPIKDYPKTQGVFVRENVGKRYLAKPEVLEGQEWVFDHGVQAVDKLHGTNVCVILDKQGNVLAIDNRTQRLQDGMQLDVRNAKDQSRAMIGVFEAAKRGWFKDIHLEDDFTRVYGELIGPGINGNMHEVSGPTFVPFQHLKGSCAWKSWVEGRYPKNFESLSESFKELPSLFSKKYCQRDILAEGLVFWHPDGRLAKLRRDMFEWYKKGE